MSSLLTEGEYKIAHDCYEFLTTHLFCSYLNKALAGCYYTLLLAKTIIPTV